MGKAMIPNNNINSALRESGMTDDEVSKWVLVGKLFRGRHKKMIPRFPTYIERNGDYVDK